MKSLDRDYAIIGLALIVLAWILVSLVEIVARPAAFFQPVARTALVVALAVAVLKGSRAASGVLLTWSILALYMGGFLGVLLVLAVGVTLFLWAGGSKAFRPRPPSIEANDESPREKE